MVFITQPLQLVHGADIGTCPQASSVDLITRKPNDPYHLGSERPSTSTWCPKRHFETQPLYDICH